jgi:hypothetical protein
MQEDLNVKYHRQDTDYYCGAACAHMILNHIGASNLQDQDTLYADNHAHSTIEPSWYTAPDGLLWTLIHYRPMAFTNNFKLFELDSEDAISRKIIWTIHNYRVPAAALVFAGQHWIVVRGYEADNAPQSPNDTSYLITSLIVNNPWTPMLDSQTTVTPPPPPHNTIDACGSGGVYGTNDEHIAYSTWQSTYMQGVIFGSHWLGKYVVICDPEPEATVRGVSQPHPAQEGQRLLSSRRVASFAEKGLRQYRLYDKPSWSNALSKTTPGKPLLVQRLDRPDSFYYNIPMQASQQRAPVMVSVNAHSGAYRQSMLLSDGGKSQTFQPLDKKTLLNKVADRRIEFEDKRGFLLLRKESLNVHPTLVWKPCRESQSPFYPFHLLTTAMDRIYIRIDGAVFTQLHEEPGL